MQPPCGSGKPSGPPKSPPCSPSAPDQRYPSHKPLLSVHCLLAALCPTVLSSVVIGGSQPITREELQVQTRPHPLPALSGLPPYVSWAQVCTNFSDFFCFLDVSEAISPVPNQACSIPISHSPPGFLQSPRQEGGRLCHFSFHIMCLVSWL